MRSATRAALTLLFPLLAASGAPAQPRPPRSDFAIGFRLLERFDPARTTKAFPGGRPIQIGYWYPVKSTSPPAALLVYGDYVGLAGRETTFDSEPDAAQAGALAQFKTFLGSAGVKPEEADFLLSTKMRAARDAVPWPAVRFPIVLIAPGNGQSAHEQAFLAEFLAARGYVVAIVPSQARIGGPMTSEAEIPEQAQAQASDLAFALRELRGLPNVWPGKYGLVAHSFGARSALLLAMRDPEAAALVSLDGGIGARAGQGLLEKAKGFDPARAALPILHLYEVGDPFMTPDLGLLRSLDRSDRWLVKVDSMRHVHFSSVGVLLRSVPALARATSANEKTAPAWDAVAAATASFLDRFVSPFTSEAGPRTSWTPAPSPLFDVLQLPASPPPARVPTPR